MTPVREEYWREQAACLLLDPSIFDAVEPKPARAAVAICAGCPVAAECFAARPEKAGGVWGGVVFNVHGQATTGRGRPKRVAA